MKRLLLGLLAFLSIGVAVVSPAMWLDGMFLNIPDKPPLVAHLVDTYTTSQLVFMLHILAGAVALLTGPWQLMPRLRARRPGLHRATGYTYAVAVTFAGIGGLILGPQAWGGPVAQVGFTTLAVLWLATTAIGLHRIIAGDRAGHRAWITRSFALAFAAVSLRMQSPLLMMLGVPDEIAYPIVAWSSWLPNLLVVQLLLARRNSTGDIPVQRRNARVNELCSANPSR
jgi:hypothetical protein